MEGPSLHLAAEQLSPFAGEVVKAVTGNTTIEKKRFKGEKILFIFSFGKLLFFQFDTFALRTHFLMFGSFQATVNKIKVTGDYPKKAREPRLAFSMRNGHIEMYSCSVKIVETADAKELCDFSIDTIAPEWDAKKAFKAIKGYPEHEIADVMLDQNIFAGLGNIIKNEVLLLAKISPERKVKDISDAKLKKIVELVRSYVFQFYEWRKKFELRKHYQVYKQKICKICGSTVIKKKTGVKQRMSHICPHCEK